ncbi:hypothetical protein [Shewanella sp.]|uniref:hypothetical protein n=1 Tax=Shewanella sp. TaxID=50422 RepID=UPI004053D0D1
MNQILLKTFGGLSKECYFRHLFFGMLFPVMLYLFLSSSSKPVDTPVMLIFFIIVNTLLYPYARFVYEKVIGFILGENVFFVNGLFLLLAKCFTMSICWAMAIFIAPVGLGYLYYYHTKNPT